MILLSAQGRDAAAITEVTFTSADRVRDVIPNFNDDGFASLPLPARASPSGSGAGPGTRTTPP